LPEKSIKQGDAFHRMAIPALLTSCWQQGLTIAKPLQEAAIKSIAFIFK